MAREIEKVWVPAGCTHIGTTVCKDGIIRPVYRSLDCNSRGEHALFVLINCERWHDYA